MKRFKNLTNKYLLTGVAFIIWMMLFDRNDIPQQLHRLGEYRELQRNEKSMAAQILDTKNELKLLKTNPETLEKYAREKYLMKKDNEDLYVVQLDSSLIK